MYMAASRLLVCTIWAPSRAGPGHPYEPDRHQTAQTAPEENQIRTARGGARDLKSIKTTRAPAG